MRAREGLWIPLLLLILASGCESEQSQYKNYSSVANGFVPNLHGFSFANYGDIEANDISNDNIAELYGSDTVCYNKSVPNCILSAMGHFYKEIHINSQKMGQCYGFAIAASMLYNGEYDFEGKYHPFDYNPNAKTSFDLNKSDVANLIAMKFINQDTPQISSLLSECKKNTMRVQFDKIEQSLKTNDPVAVLVIYDINGEQGHAVTPYKVDRVENKAKIYVYDNNFPGNSELYFDIDLLHETWLYTEGMVNAEAKNSTLYKGKGKENSFCAIPLSQTQSVSLISDENQADGMLKFSLVGGAEEVRMLISNSNLERVGYDFDTKKDVLEIDGAQEQKRLDGMPSLYKIPAPLNNTDFTTISNADDFKKFLDELFLVHVAALSQKSDTTLVGLSMSIKTDSFHSGLDFNNIVIDENGSADVAFHPGGRFFLFENTSNEDINVSLPVFRIYFDDFEKAQGAMHYITFAPIPKGLMIGVLVESLTSVRVFKFDEIDDELVEFEEGKEYSITLNYIDENNTK